MPTHSITHRVGAYIEAQGLLSRDQRIGVAVSGGADSLCLLHVLLELRHGWNLALHVVHVNHQLRGKASDDDQAFVEDMARQHGLPLYVRRAAISKSENLEQAARQARLDFFRELRGTLDRIATGHTMSDQAETVLFRLIRGSGPAGLVGIIPRTEDGIIRPLLSVTRAEVEQYLNERSIRWRTDETNLQRDFVRNRIRLDLLPHLEGNYNAGIAAQLAHTADIARDEEEFWQSYLTRFSFRKDERALILETATLAGQPKAVTRRLLREAIRQVKGDLREIEYKHVDIALRLALQQEGAGRAHLPGIDIFRSFDSLRIAPLGSYSPERRVISIPLAVPGVTPLPEGGVRLRTSLLDQGYNEDQAEGTSCNLLDLDRFEGPLTVRYWLPGDSYQPLGADRNQKLKELFQLHRVPLWERRFWPMIESSQGIVWTRRFGPAGFAAAGGSSVRRLRIDELSDD